MAQARAASTLSSQLAHHTLNRDVTLPRLPRRKSLSSLGDQYQFPSFYNPYFSMFLLWSLSMYLSHEIMQPFICSLSSSSSSVSPARLLNTHVLLGSTCHGTRPSRLRENWPFVLVSFLPRLWLDHFVRSLPSLSVVFCNRRSPAAERSH